MSFSQSFADELAELMSGAGKITQKKLFGALGFYHGSTIVGFLDEEGFYLKAKSPLADELKSMGCKPFIYKGKGGKQVGMPYWTAPQTCFDDADEMVKWIKKAKASAASHPKPAKKTSKKPTK